MRKAMKVNEAKSQMKLAGGRPKNRIESEKDDFLDRGLNIRNDDGAEFSQSSPPSRDESIDSVLFTYRSSNPYFSRSSGSGVNASQSTGVSTSKNLFPDFKTKTDGSICSADSADGNSTRMSIGSNKSRRLEFQNWGKLSKSSQSVEEKFENFALKKTDELTNFNFRVCDEGHGSDLHCFVERFPKAGKLGGKMMGGKTNQFTNEMCITGRRDSTDSYGTQYVEKDKETIVFDPMQNNSASRSRHDVPEKDVKKKRNDANSFSKKSIFNSEEIVSFFFKKKEKSNNENKLKELETVDEESNMTEDKLYDLEVSPDEDIAIKEQLKDFCFYIIFLIFFTTIALSMVSASMFYFNDMTVSLFFDTPNVPSHNKSENVSGFYDIKALGAEYPHYPGKTLRESNTFRDFWAFAETTMIDMFFWNFYYSKMDPVAHIEDDDKKMFFENQILGVPRLRQVRVRSDSCMIHPDVQRYFKSCYGYYSVFSEETRPIKKGMEGKSTATAWVYTEAKKLKSFSYWGEISIYGGGGYYLDFAPTKEETVAMVKELKDNFWVSRATRAIFLDFNLYNANVNLFCICKIVFEFPPVGGMIPVPDFHTLKLIRYLTVFDFFILGCEFIFLLFVIYYTYVEVMTIRNQRWFFFFHWWNYIDVVILLLSYGYIILSILLYVFVKKLIETLSDNYDKYTEFALVKSLQMNFNNLIAVLLFISWIKLFKYLNFNLILVEFRHTLIKSLKDILGFFPMFLTMFIAFALLAYLLFGNQIKDYNTPWYSFLTLLQAFLGEFEYREIQESNRILGPIFYMTFIFFIFFVLLNVFIAIINDAYSSVKSEVISDTPKTGAYFKRAFLNTLGCCCCGLDRKFSKRTVKKKLIYAEIIRALKNAGFSDDEIVVFFTKYNINVNNVLDEKTRRDIIKDLELKPVNFNETAEQFEISSLRRKVDRLNDKIEEMEMNMLPVIDKVDILLHRS